tara:strand:- start:442 stop:648 length:207 start_codon:yes stop_codon:yes gene_type:complete
MSKILITSFILVMLLTNKAFAYLDPGMGSIILQSILGAIVAGAAYCAMIWQKIKKIFYKTDKKEDKKN